MDNCRLPPTTRLCVITNWPTVSSRTSSADGREVGLVCGALCPLFVLSVSAAGLPCPDGGPPYKNRRRSDAGHKSPLAASAIAHHQQLLEHLFSLILKPTMDSFKGDWNTSITSGGECDVVRSRSSVLRRFNAMPLPFLKLNDSLSDGDVPPPKWNSDSDLPADDQITTTVDGTLLSTSKDEDSRDSGTYSMDDGSPGRLASLGEVDDCLAETLPLDGIGHSRRCLFDQEMSPFMETVSTFAGAFQKRFRETGHGHRESARKKRITDIHLATDSKSGESKDIASVVDYDEPDMISDYSRPYRLPTVPDRHQDLKAISASILSELVRGQFSDSISRYHIIDCRYPYEFLGGHIAGATNIWEQDALTRRFGTQFAGCRSDNAIVIFHCEFSSQRAPKMARFLRELDRQINKDHYPSLNYPEMYILSGGYKTFYEQYPSLCDPAAYKPMIHPDHLEDVKRFRSMSKAENKCSKMARRKRQLIL
ncbi:hypothetical protein LSH36_173g05051 [Paralvinella palmiformis]|uniref:M-phase inducer phosphatase n=1 Tax=Paralvinella palmiformis TaxID=53620 RepID=A0AAD9N7W7_9ANNE|nr:hypothetical protein LSH36_173g05051 [Paralvinella palmiformis]